MFRLLSLTILRHRVLGNIYLTFSQDENQEHYPEDIYTSVVIGVNGIGKSYLLRAIADYRTPIIWNLLRFLLSLTSKIGRR